MFNYGAIDKTPTVIQIMAIIKYMENDSIVKYDFNCMMEMKRIKQNEILLDLNNAHFGRNYEILFDDKNNIISFKDVGCWMS